MRTLQRDCSGASAQSSSSLQRGKCAAVSVIAEKQVRSLSWNFSVLLRLSGIPPCLPGGREFCRVHTVLGNSRFSYRYRECRRVDTVLGNFSVLIRFSGISPRCYSSREFRRAAAIVRNFAMLLQLSGISLRCYACREFRAALSVVENFAALLRLS